MCVCCVCLLLLLVYIATETINQKFNWWLLWMYNEFQIKSDEKPFSTLHIHLFYIFVYLYFVFLCQIKAKKKMKHGINRNLFGIKKFISLFRLKEINSKIFRFGTKCEKITTKRQTAVNVIEISFFVVLLFCFAWCSICIHRFFSMQINIDKSIKLKLHGNLNDISYFDIFNI